MSDSDAFDLRGVPETMLWTLHNRASEAKRSDGILRDPDAIRIYDAIAYDYVGRFGKPDASHALRSRMFDDALRPWLAAHPGATVVELACGLETQFQRCDDGQVRWICVDVPEAIHVRQRFLPPGDRCRHVASSAFDRAWMTEVGDARDVFVTAQGLFMYFEEADVRQLVVATIDRFPGVELMFDTIPRWFSKLTTSRGGFRKTKQYTSPPMPWGVSRRAIAPLLQSWSSRIKGVELVPFGQARGHTAALMPVLSRTPLLRDLLPTAVRVHTG